jgi:hypothetical protein
MVNPKSPESGYARFSLQTGRRKTQQGSQMQGAQQSNPATRRTMTT